MKKVIAIILLLVMALLFTACGDDSPCSFYPCQGRAAKGEDFCPTHKAAGWTVRN
jgi:predicted small lipoprotein YifL